jgi:hypothetical protein
MRRQGRSGPEGYVNYRIGGPIQAAKIAEMLK